MPRPSPDSSDAPDPKWMEEVFKRADFWEMHRENSSAPDASIVRPFETNFTLPSRFRDLTPIGRGGMGVVYSAFDEQTDQTVAVKVGKSIAWDSDSIKREFRTLATIRHPNLVALKELHQYQECVFFTMEYVRGQRFDCSGLASQSDGCSWKPESLAALADQLLQLVNGLDHLHSRGYVHCDIKPSNVLITKTGRVVVLDLGLARPFSSAGSQSKWAGGTPAYMSPEQASSEPLHPASDWFTFGMVLFETLFGCPPFQGTALGILFDKLLGKLTPPPSRELGVPNELTDLCMSLLDPDPEKRPDADEIRRCLGQLSNKQKRMNFATLASQTKFFGRRKELGQLHRAWVDSQKAEGPTLVFLEGDSGIGKTYLAQKFLETARAGVDTIVMTGRCYEHERIPYKAIDAVVGELASQWDLHGESGLIESSLLDAISVVFKSFSRFSSQGIFSDESPQAITQTLGAGLNAVLDGLSAQGKTPIIFIDDIQWADADSGELLAKVVRDLRVLVVCSQRPMKTANPFWVNLEKGILNSGNVGAVVERIKIDPFGTRDAEHLFEFCFPDLDKHLFEEAIAASRGVPMFLTSLVQQLQMMPAGPIESSTLNWTAGLDAQTKRLLTFICASGYPLPQSIAIKAAQLKDDWEASISELTARQLIILNQSGGEIQLTPFHDMIRESIYSGLDVSQKKSVHSTIGTLSEASKGVPPDRLAYHFRESGDLSKSCRYSISAGDVAAQSQAFGESVRTYREALENFVGTESDKVNLKHKLASSLGRLGRASEAGDLYLELATGPQKTLENLQQAAYQYCVAGRIEDALRGFDRLLHPWGYTTYQSEPLVLLRLAWLRLKLNASELSTWIKNKIPGNRQSIRRDPKHHRVADDAPLQGGDRNSGHKTLCAPNEAKLCDLLWDTAIAFSFFDMMQSGLFLHYSQQVAMKAGDDVRILRGNTWRANHEAMFGIKKEKLVRKLLAASDVSVIIEVPYLAGLHLLSTGMSDHCLGQWETAYQNCSKAEEQFQRNCENLSLFEGRSTVHLDQMGIGAAQLFGAFGLQYSGQFKAMIVRYHELMAAPENREHLLNQSNLNIFIGPYVHLSADHPEKAHQLLDDAIKMWPADKFCFQHIVAEYVRAEIYLYQRNYQSALRTLDLLWNRASGSTHFWFEILRILIWELRGRCAGKLAGAVDRSVSEKVAARSIRKLEKEKVAWASPMAQKLRAGVALRKRDFAAAEIALRQACDGFRRCNMQHYQYTTEAKLGEVTSTSEPARRQAVQQWFADQGIENQKAFVGMHYPS